MIRHKALKMRIHPSYNQRKYIYMVFAARRKVYNYILEKNLKRISMGCVSRVGVSKIYGLLNISVDSIIAEYPWLKKVPKYILLEEKKKIDVTLTEYALAITKGYIVIPPKFHSQNAIITESYIDKTKFNYRSGMNKRNHYVLNLPHLGFVETLKHFDNCIVNLQKKYNGLIFGIDIKCVHVKITHTSDDKYYAMLMFEFEDGIIEYKSKEHAWLKYQYNDVYGYNMQYYNSHIVSIDDHVRWLNTNTIAKQRLMYGKEIMCEDSIGNAFCIPKRVITLTRQTQLLQHKMNDVERYSFEQRIAYQIRYKRKQMQLNNLIISLSHELSNYYVNMDNTDIIVLSSKTHTKNHPFLKLHDTFRHYLSWKIQMEKPYKQLIHVAIPYNVYRRKTINIVAYLKQESIKYYLSLHL